MLLKQEQQKKNANDNNGIRVYAISKYVCASKDAINLEVIFNAPTAFIGFRLVLIGFKSGIYFCIHFDILWFGLL